jgi:hypothetical protein
VNGRVWGRGSFLGAELRHEGGTGARILDSAGSVSCRAKIMEGGLGATIVDGATSTQARVVNCVLDSPCSKYSAWCICFETTRFPIS